MGEITLGDSFAGRTTRRSRQAICRPACRSRWSARAGSNLVPTGDTVLSAGDGLLVVADRAGGDRRGGRTLGQTGARADSARIAPTLDYIRVFVGKASMVGIPLAQLPMPAGFSDASAACPALRRGPRAVARPDAGVRRPRRRADAARPQGRDPAALRRHRQGDGGVQLCVARARHGAGRPARA